MLKMEELILLSPPRRAFLIRIWLTRGRPSIVVGTSSRKGALRPYLTVLGLGKFLSRPQKREFILKVLDFLGWNEWDAETKEDFKEEVL